MGAASCVACMRRATRNTPVARVLLEPVGLLRYRVRESEPSAIRRCERAEGRPSMSDAPDWRAHGVKVIPGQRTRVHEDQSENILVVSSARLLQTNPQTGRFREAKACGFAKLSP